MAQVKGTRQYRMRVVPDRPFYKAVVFVVLLLLVGSLGALAFSYGQSEGLALKGEVMHERDTARVQLAERGRQIDEMRQQLADLNVGKAVDVRANEEVLQTIESLQNQIAEMQEEIRFYKGVMLPNFDEKGLRIERLDMLRTQDPNRIRYRLLLTQVVDKHEYIQGGVVISLLGIRNAVEEKLVLSDLAENTDTPIRFRFRYFQNIDGEMTLPEGFVPKQVIVVATSNGQRSGKLERTFYYALRDG